jgi:hypothetical protein
MDTDIYVRRMRIMFKKKSAQAAGKVGGVLRMAGLSHRQRAELGALGGKVRAKRLTAKQRRQIAKAAVQAREKKRAERKRGLK